MRNSDFISFLRIHSASLTRVLLDGDQTETLLIDPTTSVKTVFLFGVSQKGEEVWQCLGHDCEGLGRKPSRRDLPPTLRDRLLLGKRLVECFSGCQTEGGCALSEAWEDAGGTATRYDIRIDRAHDFLNDDKFWENKKIIPLMSITLLSLAITSL